MLLALAACQLNGSSTTSGDSESASEAEASESESESESGTSETGSETGETTGAVELPPECAPIVAAVEHGTEFPAPFQYGGDLGDCLSVSTSHTEDGDRAVFDCTLAGEVAIWAKATDGTPVFTDLLVPGQNYDVNHWYEQSSVGCAEIQLSVRDDQGLVYRSVVANPPCDATIDQVIDQQGLDLTMDTSYCPLALAPPSDPSTCGTKLGVAFELRVEGPEGWHDLPALDPTQREAHVDTLDGPFRVLVGESFHRSCGATHARPVQASLVMVRDDGP